MYKELECSLVKFLYLANEDSEVQISKKCTQIYTEMLTKFQSASNQSKVEGGTGQLEKEKENK